MSIISYALKGSLKNFDNKLNKIKKDTNKSKIYLYIKFLYCFILIGSGYSDYLNYELYKKKSKEIKEYASIKTQDKFYSIVSPSKYKSFFSTKSEFLKNFSKYIKRDSFYKGTLDELKTFLSANEKIMYKPVTGLAGESVKSIITKEIKDIAGFYEEICEKNILLEGYVKQHPDVSKFAPKSCNTIRIMTFGYRGKSEILCALMRFGNGENDVDNFHKGGMACLVDIESGVLIGDAINKDVQHFSHHPKSKIKFAGFQIPNWEYIKKMVLEAANVSDKIHVVGWDVAVLEDGATFIEGNRRPGFDIVQVLYQHGKRDIMRRCLDIINKNENTKYKV